jgi:uncharacterized alpha-E superfamily protein
MHFCLIKAHGSLQSITGSSAGTFLNLSEQQMGRLCSNMNCTSIKDVIQRGLHEFIDDFQLQLNLVGNSIVDDYVKTHRPAVAAH